MKTCWSVEILSRPQNENETSVSLRFHPEDHSEQCLIVFGLALCKKTHTPNFKVNSTILPYKYMLLDPQYITYLLLTPDTHSTHADVYIYITLHITRV